MNATQTILEINQKAANRGAVMTLKAIDENDVPFLKAMLAESNLVINHSIALRQIADTLTYEQWHTRHMELQRTSNLATLDTTGELKAMFALAETLDMRDYYETQVVPTLRNTSVELLEISRAMVNTAYTVAIESAINARRSAMHVVK